MNFKQQLQNFRRYYNEGGLYSVFHRLTVNQYLPHWLVYLYGTYILELTRFNNKLMRRDMSKFQFIHVDETALDDICDCSDEDAPDDPRDTFTKFFNQGSKCYVIKDDQQVVTYMWAFTSTYELQYDDAKRNITLDLDKDVVFLGNGHIAKEYRLKGLFPYAIDYIVRQHSQSTRFFTAIDYYNTNSINSHLRLGYKKIAIMTCFSMLKFNSFWITIENRSRQFLGFVSPKLNLPFN